MRFLKLLLVLMGVLASDDFNRANENPLGNGVWTTGTSATAMRIVGNVATPTDIATTDDVSYYSGISWPADQFSRAKLTVSSTLGGNRGPGIVVRQSSGANTHYRLTADHAASNNVVLAKVVAGTFTALAGFPVTQAWSDGDTWELQVIGNLFKAFRNGVQVGPTATDSAIASGSPGIVVSVDVTSASIDDWNGGIPDLAAPIPVVYKPLTLLRCRPLGPGNPLREVKYYEVPPAAAPGVTLTPDVGSLIIDGFAPTVGLPVTLTPATGDLTLTGFAPVTGLPVTLRPALGQLTLSGSAPSIGLPLTVTPGLGQLILSGFAPTTGLPVTLRPGLGQLTLSGFAPSLGSPVNLFPGFGQLTVTGFAPVLGVPVTLMPGSGNVTLGGFAPALGLPATMRPGLGLLSLDGFEPTITLIAPLISRAIAVSEGEVGVSSNLATDRLRDAVSETALIIPTITAAASIVRSEGSITLSPLLSSTNDLKALNIGTASISSSDSETIPLLSANIATVSIE